MESYELIEREAASMLDRARDIVVNCDEEYSAAGEFIMGCKQLIAKIKDDFREPKRKADEAHKAITKMEKRTLEPVESAMSVAGQTALVYKREQDRLAKEEADRIAAEKRREEEERRLEQAAALEAKGDIKAAEEVISAPIVTPRGNRFVSSVPKVEGLSARTTWKARVINTRLVKREFCTPDQALINIHVNKFFPKGMQSEKKTLTPEQVKLLEEEIGGVEIYEDGGFAGRVKA